MSTFEQRPDTKFDIAKRDSVRMHGNRYILQLFAQRFPYMLIRANKHIRERRNAKYKFTITGFVKTPCQI